MDCGGHISLSGASVWSGEITALNVQDLNSRSGYMSKSWGYAWPLGRLKRQGRGFRAFSDTLEMRDDRKPRAPDARNAARTISPTSWHRLGASGIEIPRRLITDPTAVTPQGDTRPYNTT